jgi:predicted methyltransferase
MSSALTKFHGALLCLPLLGAALALSSQASAADIYDTAVQHPGRPENDLKRDGLEHPAEVLRLAGIKPGMQVGDVMAASGYYVSVLPWPMDEALARG